MNFTHRHHLVLDSPEMVVLSTDGSYLYIGTLEPNQITTHNGTTPPPSTYHRGRSTSLGLP